MNIVPTIPDDVKAHIEANGYELHGSRGCWYVSGEEDGEPFELGLDLFTALYRANQ